ncbi:unnamed protein product [Gordionus sp. m RMFG-2023]|uniref:glutaredoxin-3-like n=1 Tax=Gordionus sp. m RMFG-2023 TaxID=3053472 RepID=UPI0030E002A5
MAQLLIECSTIEDIEARLQEKQYHIFLLFFSAPWSPQCNEVSQALTEHIKNPDYSDMIFIKIDSESVPDLLEKYRIEMVPTFVFIQNNKIVDRVDGLNPIELNQKLKYWAMDIPRKGKLNFDSHNHNTSIKTKPVTLEDKLKNLINKNKFMLFMKGSPDHPQCGFSKQIVSLLNKNGIEFEHFDILQDPEVRDGLKIFSNWPTYPQLYINGELVGGLDIVKEMDENGELKTMLNDLQNVENKQIKSTDSGDTKSDINRRIEKLINIAPVMVFMKGEVKNPMCKFSKELIPILNETSIPYSTFDILEDEEIRQGLKEYTDWPTYPQIYVNGQFVGGLDIIKELKETGQLNTTLKGQS